MASEQKVKIALLGGGYSEEAPISLNSCKYLLEELSAIDAFDIVQVIIDSPNRWFAKKGNQAYLIDKNDFGFIDHSQQKQTFDVVHNCIHGTPGEDGKIQHYLESLDIPYIGSNATCSMITFHKQLAKLWATSIGVQCPKGIFLSKNSTVNTKEICNELSFPMIVKPNEGGSSIGIALVDNEASLIEAIHKTVAHQNVLIENCIQGREFSVGVFTNIHDEVEVLPITEIKPHNTFFDYDAKYNKQSDEITPAMVREEQQSLIQTTAQKVYKSFACSFFVRMDFILTEDGNLYFLEINTIPGFTKESILPQQLRLAKIDFKTLYQDIVNKLL